MISSTGAVQLLRNNDMRGWYDLISTSMPLSVCAGGGGGLLRLER